MSARTLKGFVQRSRARRGVRAAGVRRVVRRAPPRRSSCPARNGKTIDLSQFKGQVVMINFWATWCGPCRQEMPLLEDIYKKYKPMGFTMLAVNVEPDSDGRRGVAREAQQACHLPGRVRHRQQGQQALQGGRHAEHRVRRSQGQLPRHAQGLQARR